MLTIELLKAMDAVADDLIKNADELLALMQRVGDSRGEHEFKSAVGSAVGQVYHVKRRIERELKWYGPSKDNRKLV